LKKNELEYLSTIKKIDNFSKNFKEIAYKLKNNLENTEEIKRKVTQ